MLRVLGSSKRLCTGVTRRDLLWAGGLSLFGLTLTDHLKASNPDSRRSPGGARHHQLTIGSSRADEQRGPHEPGQ